MDPISRKPYGPAANNGCIERPDIRQYLTHMPLFVRSRACQPGGCPHTYAEPALAGSGCVGQGVIGLAVPGQQLVDVFAWVLGDAVEHFGEPRLRVEAVQLGRLDEGYRRWRRPCLQPPIP